MIVTPSLATVAMPIIIIVIACGFLCWLALEIVVRRREASNPQSRIQPTIPAKRPRDARGRFCKP
jgi:hypothetical protein